MARRKPDDQLALFAFEPDPGPDPKAVRPADQPEEVEALGQELPKGIHLGGSTWSFPGWSGLVYDRTYPSSKLAREGLAAYARHPLFRGVGVDRTHYSPVEAEELAEYRMAVPEDFRFLVKAHEACTLSRFPDHARYGIHRGQVNSLFLDPAYAADQVVAPFVDGMGEDAGALLFQFAPQSLGTAGQFAERLHAFLSALPRGPVYAVEVRNRELVTAEYGEALASVGACHCHNVHPRMPDIRAQAHLAGTGRGPMTVIRWLLGPGMTYEEAGTRYAPFNRMAAPDEPNRQAVADLARDARAGGRPFLCTINNNAEGCAPLSVVELAREIVGGGGEDGGTSEHSQ
jgi:uncharacterized protein YecE (DUF72 family)